MIRRYRPDLSAWIVIGVISSIPWLVVWASGVRYRIDITGVVIATGVSTFAFTWLISFCIILTPTEVIFRSLFGGRQSIRHAQIKRVRLTWSLRSRTQGPLRLLIEPVAHSDKKDLDINAKVFSKAAISAVLDLGRRVAEADDGGLLDGIVLKTLRKWKQPPKI